MSTREVSKAAEQASTAPGADSTSYIEPTLCGVCHQNESKYKCIRCEIPFCSVVCSTQHRTTHPAVDAPKPTVDAHPNSNINNTNPFPGSPATVRPHNPFLALDNSKELETLFLIYPRLRSQLRNIYLATQPPCHSGDRVDFSRESTQQHRGQMGGRTNGWAGRGAAARDKGTWNLDKGTQDGIDALSRAKGEYGKGGEGIRDYIALVMKLVSVDGDDFARIVQEEVAAENAKIINQLLTGEGY